MPNINQVGPPKDENKNTTIEQNKDQLWNNGQKKENNNKKQNHFWWPKTSPTWSTDFIASVKGAQTLHCKFALEKSIVVMLPPYQPHKTKGHAYSECPYLSSWWFQPIWNGCSSNWNHVVYTLQLENLCAVLWMLVFSWLAGSLSLTSPEVEDARQKARPGQVTATARCNKSVAWDRHQKKPAAPNDQLSFHVPPEHRNNFFEFGWKLDTVRTRKTYFWTNTTWHSIKFKAVLLFTPSVEASARSYNWDSTKCWTATKPGRESISYQQRCRWNRQFCHL